MQTAIVFIFYIINIFYSQTGS